MTQELHPKPGERPVVARAGIDYPATITDELASQVSWHPARSSGSRVWMMTLKTTEAGKISVVRNGTFHICVVLLLLHGLAMFGLISLVHVCVLAYLLESNPTVTIDRAPGTVAVDHPLLWFRSKTRKLTDVRAIQILKEHVRPNKGAPYWSYELNLVFRDGSRMNLTDVSDEDGIRGHAKIISEYLGVPVWDASDL